MARVLILGSGFGGIATAVALREQLSDADEVVLVDRHDDFAMGLRKTWAILGISPIAYGTRSLASLARRGIEFLK
jgi:NADH dehydrogenase FAD-containing subunit